MESRNRGPAGVAGWYRLRAVLLIAAASAGLGGAEGVQAQQLGDPFVLAQTGSCPTFHCDAEGTSLMQHALPMPDGEGALSATDQLDPESNDMPGAIGCSSDDSNVVCLFDSGSDAAISFAVGAQGQASMVRNFVLQKDTNDWKPWPKQFGPYENQDSNHAPVPLMGADHSVIIADGNWVKRYTQTGIQVWPTSVSPVTSGDVGLQLGYEDRRNHSRSAVGVTPIQWGDETAVAVTFLDGRNAWSRGLSNIVVYRTTDGSFIARYPADTADSSTQGIQIADDSGVVHTFGSISPPVSHGGSLYFAGYEDSSNLGVLARFDLSGDPSDQGASQLALSAYVTFGGQTGASPAFEDSNRFTNFPFSQIVLQVPDPSRGTLAALGCDLEAGGMPETGSHLVSLSPDLSGCNWASALNTSPGSEQSASVIVAPVIDPVDPGFWIWTSAGTLQNTGGSTIFHYPASGGVFDRSINVLATCEASGLGCGDLPGIIGHLQAVNPPDSGRLYLTTFIGAQLGTALPMIVVAFDATSGLRNDSIIQWLAPIGGLNGDDTGGALPLVTFTDGVPGLMLASSARHRGVGNVSLIAPD